MTPTLFLIPSALGNEININLFPPYNLEMIYSLDHFIVENIRTARRFLRPIGYKNDFEQVKFFELNKHTSRSDLESYINPLLKGINMGILSEAGAPAVADPGAEIVKLAHKNNIKVVPLIGPSSILLALMASGLNGQNFSFNGYLPVKNTLRKKAILNLEKKSRQENQSQIFMETPYRNQNILEDILSSCHPETLLCIATEITLKTEYIQTKQVNQWKKEIPNIHKRPSIFILHGY